MGFSPNSLTVLLGERGPCPVCDQFDCTHQFYGDDFWRIGDPMAKHPKMQGRTIPAPHRIIEGERVIFGEGDLMTPAEAVKYGVTVPGPAPKGKRKGERSKRLQEDRSREHLGEDR